MTLLEMRQMLRDNAFDRSGDFLDDTTANRYVNAAAQHIGNWADSLRQGVFIKTATLSGYNGTGDFPTVAFYGSTGTFQIDPAVNPFRRMVAVWRTNFETDKWLQLDLIESDDRFKHRDTSAQEVPKAFVLGQSLGFVRPAASLDILIEYATGLPIMTLDSDTPGTRGGSGLANRLPEAFHPIIVTYATLLALSAMKTPLDRWPDIYTEQREELQASLIGRKGSRS